jgi:hypothetical protein
MLHLGDDVNPYLGEGRGGGGRRTEGGREGGSEGGKGEREERTKHDRPLPFMFF